MRRLAPCGGTFRIHRGVLPRGRGAVRRASHDHRGAGGAVVRRRVDALQVGLHVDRRVEQEGEGGRERAERLRVVVVGALRAVGSRRGCVGL
eukprot:2920290-Prymnesium_polylepis.2